MFLARTVGAEGKRTEQQNSHSDLAYVEVYNKHHIATSRQSFSSYSVG